MLEDDNMNEEELDEFAGEELNDELEGSVEDEKRDYSDRSILLVEPDEAKAKAVEDILQLILPGVNLVQVDDCDEAMEVSTDGEFDTYIIDLQYDEFSTSEFIKDANNDSDVLLVAFDVTNIDPADYTNRFKLEPLKKLFDNDKNNKIKV